MEGKIMPKTGVFLKVAQYIGTALAFVFSFVGYTLIIRSQIEDKYLLGFLDGAILGFCLTALPLAYAYLSEKEKKKKKK
jgi:hypothetical protein